MVPVDGQRLPAASSDGGDELWPTNTYELLLFLLVCLGTCDTTTTHAKTCMQNIHICFCGSCLYTLNTATKTKTKVG